jgi:DNA-binding Xre family transcriptional regulator
VRELEEVGFEWNPTQEFHKGERHPLSKLSDKQVAAIYRSKKSKEALAAEYGVTHWTIQDIWHGKSRTDTTDKLPPRKVKVKRHLTPEQVLEIYRADGTQQEIADRFGMSRANVSLIKSGKQWPHVTGHKARAKK